MSEIKFYDDKQKFQFYATGVNLQTANNQESLNLFDGDYNTKCILVLHQMERYIQILR